MSLKEQTGLVVNLYLNQNASKSNEVRTMIKGFPANYFTKYTDAESVAAHGKMFELHLAD